MNFRTRAPAQAENVGMPKRDAVAKVAETFGHGQYAKTASKARITETLCEFRYAI